MKSLNYPYDQRESIPPDVLAYDFVPDSVSVHVVGFNFDALATGKHIKIDMREIVFLWWDQDSNRDVCGT